MRLELIVGLLVLVVGLVAGLVLAGNPGTAITPTPGAQAETQATPPGTATPPTASTSYTVQPGDTLGAIAERHGLTVAAIAAANGLREPYPIQVGQVLSIPSRTGPAPSPSPADLDLLVQVDKGHPLSSAFVPSDLEGLGSIPSLYAGLRVRAVILPDLRGMIAAAAARGIDLKVVSAYRSYADQEQIFRREVALVGETEASRYVARPGHSEHQLGTTVDVSGASVGYTLEERLGSAPEGLWLRDNAWRYGFALSYPQGQEAKTGYAYEPWHFRYVGTVVAEALHTRRITLSEYLSSR